jgi:S-DNA-T family DNA segregation ATPase FtsK/SpoIIIE
MLWTLLLAALAMFIGPANFVTAYHATMAFSHTASERISAYIAEHQDRKSLIEKEERLIDRRRAKLEKTMRKSPKPKKLQPKLPDPIPEEETAPAGIEPEPLPEPEPEKPKKKEEPRKNLLDRIKPERKPKPKPKPKAEPTPVIAPNPDAGYQLPPISLLEEAVHSEGGDMTADTATAGRVLEETLLEFDIEAKVTHVERGPVVTRYELLPAAGIRIERISALSNNLALAMKASSLRIQAPVPGKGVVGIEIPNSVAKKVFLREILEGDVWNSGKAALPLVLGKDVGGNDIVADLATMPHILIAGATGAGKTVCMNSVLAGLLMARRPDQMKLMLVDPKIVEFGAYNDLPHLVVPVITKPKKVSLGLRWAINEMEKRYKLFAKVGVRNIEAYNNREVATQEDMFVAGEGGEEQEQKGPPRTVPYIVIVIDELADLMLADGAEIENCVARLAQLSRAVGIHMILSTQRPSVNVITGTIKANFPARIAFQVAQKVDSRTILDTVGADKLLGRGDMLYLPPGSSKLIRAQGSLTSDEEINRITEFIKQQGTPDYVEEIKEKLEKKAVVGAVDDGSEDDDMLEQAIQIIRETKRASTSSLQRRLRIGYTRAARMMDILEERGIIGPPRGSDPREILIDLDGEIPNNDVQEEVEQ